MATLLFIFLKAIIQNVDRFQSVFSETYVISLKKEELNSYLKKIKSNNIKILSMQNTMEGQVLLEISVLFHSEQEKLDFESYIIKNENTIQMYKKQ